MLSKGLPAGKLQGQSTRINRSWCKSSMSKLSLRHPLVSSSLVLTLLHSTFHLQDPTHPLLFFFLSGWTTRHVGSVPRPEIESTPCPQHWKGTALITRPPGKSLEDSSLCHLLDEPFRTRLITTSWTGFQYLYSLPTLPTTTAEGRTHSHQPCRQALSYGANSGPDGNRGSAENQG